MSKMPFEIGNALYFMHQNGRIGGNRMFRAVDGYVATLATRLFKEGPECLTSQQKRALLADGETLAFMHNLIWKTPSEMMHPAWALALARYRSSFRRIRPKPEAPPASLTKTHSAAA